VVKTVLVVGDAPRVMGHYMVCKLLNSGYHVKAPNRFSHSVDDELVGSLSQMDLMVGTSIIQEDENFVEIEYDPNVGSKLEQVISGCDCVVYLSSVLFDCRSEINSSTNGVVDTEALKSVANFSRSCGVHQFICGSIPILYRTEGDTEVAKDIRVNYSDISQELFLESVDGELIVTFLQPHLIPSDFHRRKQYFNLKTISNHTINERKIRLFGSNKKQSYFVPSIQFSEKKAQICDFQVKAITDICLLTLEASDLVDKKNWLYRKLYQIALEHYYLGRYLVNFIKNPRVPFWGRVKFAVRSAKRLFDVFMMMLLFHIWPEQVYRFSTRKLLPNRSERFNINDRATIPLKLIESKTNKIQRTEELNVVMRGSSFDVSKLDELKEPIYLVNFSVPIRTQRDVVYVEQSIKFAYKLRQLGVSVCHVEGNRVAENGETFPPDSYLSSDIYKKLLDDPGFKRIAVAENICRPFKLPLSSSWRPTGAGLHAICALSNFANTIKVYGWDFYLDSSPEYMSSWEAFSNLYKYKLDNYRSRLHFECAIINYYYGYHLSKLPNINNYGYMGKLDRHERLIRKIERVLFN